MISIYMKTKHFFLCAAMLFAFGHTWAQGPNNSGVYYKDANGKKGEALKTALYNIIKSPSVVGYSGLGDKYKLTDKRSDGYLRDWYSNATNYTWNDAGGNSAEGAGWNKEHSVPQSWFNEASPMKSDIVHVVPTDCYVNNRRGSYLIAEVNTVSWSSKNQYSKLGTCKTSGYSGTVFEPNDEIKGDMARIYFYMVTCYQDKFMNWKKGEATKIFSTSSYPGFQDWYMDMLMRWSKEDPIDDIEIARNNAVQTVQGNRNPFVDYPGLEDYIWGSKQDEQFFYDSYNIDPCAYIAMPTISPDAGTYYNSVEVTITSNTEGASIYYTTNGQTPTAESTLYEGAFTLNETTTVKAIAVKEELTSSVATAIYTISQEVDPITTDGDINLNNALFGTSYTGGLNNNIKDDLTGSQNGISVVYALGTGSNRFCNDSQIRLYPGNTLTISCSQYNITEITFTLPETSSNVLQVNTGTISGSDKTRTWSGEAKTVVFSVNGSSGHMKLSKFTAKTDAPATDPTTGIDGVQTNTLTGKRVIYNLQGQRVTNPTRGMYIVDGKKIFIQ